MCICNSGIETTNHFFLHCDNFSTHRQTLFDKINSIDSHILTDTDNNIVKILLYGNPSSEDLYNKEILNASIEYILSTERFNNPLF